MSETTQPYLGYYPESELVLGLVCPLGTNYRAVLQTLIDNMAEFGYKTNAIRLSDEFEDVLTQLHAPLPDSGSGAAAEMRSKILLGNQIRRLTQNDVLALIAAAKIASLRAEVEKGDPKPRPLEAHVIATLKHPKEVETLRRVYGAGFFLIGIASSEDERQAYFRERAISADDATGLIEIDAKEEFEYGQQTRDTFHLSDVFVSLKEHRSQIGRFLDLLFGCPYQTPTAEESAMFQAYATSLRSGDLSRQVGAALISPEGDLLATGCNEVPKFGGGQYGTEAGNQRDMVLGYDSNEIEKMEMADRILAALDPNVAEAERPAVAKRVLKPSGFFDITEFGRTVHAEMEAILACGRNGRSTRGATLYTTTFPCHNCTRHAIGAGISKVVYIEPYAKSKAFQLHSDAITADESSRDHLPFLPFIGVGPRRYFDLFSLTLGSGYPVERKGKGRVLNWNRAEATLRLQMQPTSYLQREVFAFAALGQLLSDEGGD
ncbi:MAG: cytidine deaminase [Acidobacteria bacterium]|nr:cytidine deaminase [Acidobacteriota bacterium]